MPATWVRAYACVHATQMFMHLRMDTRTQTHTDAHRHRQTDTHTHTHLLRRDQRVILPQTFRLQIQAPPHRPPVLQHILRQRLALVFQPRVVDRRGVQRLLLRQVRRVPQGLRAVRPPLCVGSCVCVCVSVCLSVCLPAGVPACLSVCLSVCMDACLPVCLHACTHDTPAPARRTYLQETARTQAGPRGRRQSPRSPPATRWTHPPPVNMYMSMYVCVCVCVCV